MFAVNHAATALLLKRRYRDAPLVWLLISVQALEILWVLFNAIGVERTTTDENVAFVGNIHLSYMPYSHSVFAAILIAGASWGLVRLAFRSSRIAVAIGIGVLSHIVLDLVTHAPDIAIVPWSDVKVGLGLYSTLPLLAFFLELAYGVACWWVFGGSRGLLAVIVVFTLANLTLFVPDLVGVEGQLAGRPLGIVGLVAVQIVVTLVLVGWLARRQLAVRSARRSTIASAST